MATGVVIAGAVVVVWAGIALEEELAERWYLWKLDSAEEADREPAAAELGRMKSRRAIPRLVEILRRTPENQHAVQSLAFSADGTRIITAVIWDAATGVRLITDARSHYSFKALVEIGRPAVPALRQLLEDADGRSRSAAALALNAIDPEAHPEGLVLRAMLSRKPAPES